MFHCKITSKINVYKNKPSSDIFSEQKYHCNKLYISSLDTFTWITLTFSAGTYSGVRQMISLLDLLHSGCTKSTTISCMYGSPGDDGRSYWITFKCFMLLLQMSVTLHILFDM